MDILQLDLFQEVHGTWGLYSIWEQQKVPGQVFWLGDIVSWGQGQHSAGHIMKLYKYYLSLGYQASLHNLNSFFSFKYPLCVSVS